MLCWLYSLNAAIQQHESVITICISPPSWASLHTPHSTHLNPHRAPGWTPCVIQQLLLASYFTHKWKSLSCVQLFATPWTIQSMEFSKPEYWSGYLFPSPGDLPNQGSNPGLPHCMQILYQLSHKGSPRILEWVSYSFSSRSTWPRNPINVCCIAGRFFTNWTIRDAKPGILKHWSRDSLHLVVVATRC